MIRALASIGTIQVLVMLVALGRAKILSTTLGPSAFGVMSTIDQAVLSILQVGTFALPLTALRLMAKGHSESDAEFRKCFAAFFRGLTALSVLLTVLCIVVLALKADAFGDDLSPYRGFLVIAMLSLPALILHILFVHTLAAAEASVGSAGLNLAVSFLLAGAAVSGALAAGIGGAYAATAATGIITAGGALVYLRTRFGFRLLSPSASIMRTLKEHPDLVAHSGQLWVALSAYSITFFAMRYVVLSVLGAEHAGLLQAQLSVAVTAGAVLAPMSALYLAPIVNRQAAIGEKMAVANGFAGRVILLLLILGLPLTLFPQLAMGMLFSPAFERAGHLLFVFLAWQVLYQVTNVYRQLLIGLGDVRFSMGLTCAAYAVALVLFPVLVPVVGTAGVGLALVAAMVVSGCGAALRLRARFGELIAAVVWRRFALVAAAVVGGGLLFQPDTERLAWGIALRVAFAVSALAVAWRTLTHEERRLVRRQLTRREPNRA